MIHYFMGLVTGIILALFGSIIINYIWGHKNPESYKDLIDMSYESYTGHDSFEDDEDK